MFITAETHGGVALLGVLGYHGVPDTCSFFFGGKGIKGVFTGVLILACVILVKNNSKTGTKSFCFWGD